MNKSGKAGAKLRLSAAMLIFGTIGVFVRYIPLPSALIAAARGVIGTIFLLVVIRAGHSRLSLPDIRRNLLKLCLSGVCLGANWILLFEAYRRTTVAVATLCYYLAPVFVILVSPLVFREKLTARKALCALTALLGMALVSGLFLPGAAGGLNGGGILFGLGAAVLYACVMLLTRALTSVAALDVTVVQLGTAAMVLLPYTFFTTDMSALAFTPLSLTLLLTVGVVHTGLCYALYFGAMKELPAQTTAIFSYIDPVAAVLVSALILREPMDALSAVGAVMILGATLVSELGERKTHERP